MPVSNAFRPVTIQPMTGLMDLRSTPDEVPVGGYRFVENWTVPQLKRLQRMPGWTKAFPDDSPYNNGDLHDQLEGYTPQHVTMLFEAPTPAGFKHLFAGTQNRIYARNPSTGNWRVISDLLGGVAQVGCPEKRFYGASLRHNVLFTKGVDPIMHHVIDQPLIETNVQGVTTIADLDRMGITRAKVAVSFGNLMFLMNIEQDGRWYPNRIVCSDFDNAVSYFPGAASVAARQDLDPGESILSARPVKGGLLILTTTGIWQLDITGSENTFAVGKRWTSGDGKSGVLAYRNTLVSDGENIYYWGRDGIYRYSMFDQAPVREEWIHRASSRIFEDIDRNRCAMHVGGFQGDDAQKQIWWSWGRVGDNCPSETIVVNAEYEFTSYVDHGFSAFVYHEPDTPTSLRDFVLERCICTLTEWAEYAGFIKEGGLCVDEEPATCDTVPASFYSQTARTVAPGVVTEDWTGEPDADSLFSILGNVKVSDLCSDEYAADECNAEQAFIFASVEDMCLKQAGQVNYREVCTVKTGCGTYRLDGYQSRLLSGPLSLGIPDDDKVIRRLVIEAHTLLESTPAQVTLRIGISNQAVDPMEAPDRCVIVWDADLDIKTLECLGRVAEATHKAEGTRPSDSLEWPLFHQGRYIYFDIVVKNANVLPADTGGFVSFSRMTFDVVARPRAYGH